jgi:hypothetical protein
LVGNVGTGDCCETEYLVWFQPEANLLPMIVDPCIPIAEETLENITIKDGFNQFSYSGVKL